MRIGYNTNGLAHHDPVEAIGLLAETGFTSVAITVDHSWLSPKSETRDVELQRLKFELERHGMHSVVETGARFLLSPNRKHFPTLLEPDQKLVQQRVDFIRYCIDVAVELGSDCVSIWSGARPEGIDFQTAMDHLARSLHAVLDYAGEHDMVIGFEPEPGMLVDTTGRFERLLHLIDAPHLKMTMDIGHLFCLSEVPIAAYIEKWADRIVNVHIEDMQAGVHEHLMFGDGQIYFPPVIESLVEMGYQGGLHVELSRHSHNAAEVVRQSWEFLNPIVQDALLSKGL